MTGTTSLPTTSTSVTAIYVSWRDRDELEASVRSLVESLVGPADSIDVSLIVVLNESQPGESAQVQEIWAGALVIENTGNPGYGRSANQAAARAEGDYLLLLNPDTRAFGSPIAEIVRGFREHPEASAIAPRLVDWPSTGGESQTRFQLRRFPRLTSDIRELLLVDHLLPRNRWLRHDRYLGIDRARPLEVQQAAAAALAVRRSAFEAVAGFDPRFVPAWFEDVDLCRRLHAVGRILYWPDATFFHRGGGSASTLGRGRFMPIYYRNAIRYRQVHYSRGAGVAYRAAVVTGMVLRILAAPLLAEPGTRRDAVRGYAAVARMCLGRVA